MEVMCEHADVKSVSVMEWKLLSKSWKFYAVEFSIYLFAKLCI
jgi:hypothetical protein